MKNIISRIILAFIITYIGTAYYNSEINAFLWNAQDRGNQLIAIILFIGISYVIESINKLVD